jgi:hypothetical protein
VISARSFLEDFERYGFDTYSVPSEVLNPPLAVRLVIGGAEMVAAVLVSVIEGARMWYSVQCDRRGNSDENGVVVGRNQARHWWYMPKVTVVVESK